MEDFQERSLEFLFSANIKKPATRIFRQEHETTAMRGYPALPPELPHRICENLTGHSVMAGGQDP